MENNILSIGTYSISSDGVSINYSAPSFLPVGTVKKIIMDKMELDKIEEPKLSFGDTLSEVIEIQNK
jgi:hypothetical protein